MSLEFLVLMPVVLVIIVVVFQTALLFHAQHTVSVAAEEAVEAGKVGDATDADATDGAMAVLSRTGALGEVSITVERTVDLVTVTVTGDAPTLFGSWQVTSTAQSHTERFIEVGQR